MHNPIMFIKSATLGMSIRTGSGRTSPSRLKTTPHMQMLHLHGRHNKGIKAIQEIILYMFPQES